MGEYDADVPYDQAVGYDGGTVAGPPPGESVKGESVTDVGIGPRLPTSPVTQPVPEWTGPWPHEGAPAAVTPKRVEPTWIDRAGLVCAALLAVAMVWAAWLMGASG